MEKTSFDESKESVAEKQEEKVGKRKQGSQKCRKENQNVSNRNMQLGSSDHLKVPISLENGSRASSAIEQSVKENGGVERNVETACTLSTGIWATWPQLLLFVGGSRSRRLLVIYVLTIEALLQGDKSLCCLDHSE